MNAVAFDSEMWMNDDELAVLLEREFGLPTVAFLESMSHHADTPELWLKSLNDLFADRKLPVRATHVREAEDGCNFDWRVTNS